MKRRNIVGDVINYKGLVYGPVNENGVIFLFSKISEELEIKVETIRAGFPDCVAKRQLRTGFWEELKIEFEFRSSDFVRHGHNPDNCDMIVCWKHDWTETPKNLEIFELKSYVEKQPERPAQATLDRKTKRIKHVKDFDTVIVPARKDGFERVFLGMNQWYQIRLREESIPKLKWIAAYQTAPVSAITHLAKIKEIKPYKNSGKFIVYFEGQAKKIRKIPHVSKEKGAAPQGLWFTNRSFLKKARSMNEVR